jgi:23S rRNA (cytosine1962-C5)-methyltransferase
MVEPQSTVTDAQGQLPALLPSVILKSGRDKSVRNRHPRLFSGAIKEVQGRPKEGWVVDVRANTGEWLARGIINQQAQIAVRLLTWNPDETIDDAFWQHRVQQAVERRQRDPLLAGANARRLLFGESDGLPGVIADEYAGHVVLQLSTLAAVNARAPIVAGLCLAANPRSIVERSDEERMKHEHVKETSGVLYGQPPDGPVEIVESGQRFLVDPAHGQKTGFYLDQRENRARVARYCQGAAVLNAFSYTGAFAVYAAAGGAASVVNVDSSTEALRLAEANVALMASGASASTCIMSYVAADVFTDIRARRAAGERFDVVILDPPKFAHNPGQVDRAARAYKDLNRVGLALLRPGGILATFSCSGVVDAALFQKIIFSAAVEAGRDVQVVERLTQASDHPVLLSFPESEYLKGLVCRVN